MAQIRQVVSEALQSQIRNLLPSQQGFTEDLQASNVITPIIDLTPTAEGQTLDTDLSRALAFGSQTAFTASNATVTLANTPGFWLITFGVTLGETNPQGTVKLQLSDGLSTKDIWGLYTDVNSTSFSSVGEFTIFLASGESVSIGASNSNVQVIGSYRQIADVNGTIVNPSGFSAS